MVSDGNTLLVCGHEADALGDQVVGALVGDVVALERDRAGADLHQAEQRLEQRRLAGAVGADDADQLVLLAVQVGAVEDVDAGQVARDQVVGAQHGALGGLRGAPRARRRLSVARLGSAAAVVGPSVIGRGTVSLAVPPRTSISACGLGEDLLLHVLEAEVAGRGARRGRRR